MEKKYYWWIMIIWKIWVGIFRSETDLRRIFNLEDSDHEMNHLKEWVTFFGFVGNIEIMYTANILCGQQMTV